jgi:hypothetical protein
MLTAGHLQSSAEGKGRKNRVPVALVATILLALPLFFVSVPSTEAATVVNLTDCHFSSGCGPGGTVYATVTLTQNGLADGTGDVDLLVHVNDPYYFQKTPAVDLMAFVFDAVGVALTDITLDPHTPTLTRAQGPFTASGVGTFDFGITCSSCGNGLSDKFNTDISFNVVNSRIADFTDFGANLGDPATDLGGPVGVPEPGTLFVFSGGLTMLAVGSIWRRKRAMKSTM